ncbi:Magnetosome protein MamL-like [Candidatus Magnetaquicoccaceae bacterium FCR-1]|uniref:Magnetosome protein MamL-like n=1 Tax=Candidatus Magnetaquiglobus chichijimensis TaxID=3141448 RepID=A0ABQ0CAF0_9PROT
MKVVQKNSPQRDKESRSRAFLSLLLAILLLIFASQNMHSVQIRLIVGPPLDLPLILIISGAFIAGFLLATVNHLARKVLRIRRRNEEP